MREEEKDSTAKCRIAKYRTAGRGRALCPLTSPSPACWCVERKPLSDTPINLFFRTASSSVWSSCLGPATKLTDCPLCGPTHPSPKETHAPLPPHPPWSVCFGALLRHHYYHRLFFFFYSVNSWILTSRQPHRVTSGQNTHSKFEQFKTRVTKAQAKSWTRAYMYILAWEWWRAKHILYIEKHKNL